MKNRIPRLLAALPVLALASAIGSGCGGSGGVKKVTVTGSVTYGGKPVGNGMVTFTLAEADLKGGSNAQGPVVNGKFSVPGVSPGKNSVTVTGGGPAPQQSEGPAGYEKMRKMPDMNKGAGAAKNAMKQAASTDTIPPDAPGNSIKVDVKEGMEPLDIKILKK
jgi:hypothetical protein